MSTGNLHNAMRSLTAATLIALSAVTLSCTKTQIEPETPKGPAIEFSTKDPWTKATDEAALNALKETGFKVWGWFEGTTSGHIFHSEGKTDDGTHVTHVDGNWTYSPAKYWMNGLYDFAAVYPTTVAGTYAPAQPGEDPILTIPNFDVASQEDLLVAFNTNIDGSTHPEFVSLNFRHLLTKVNLKVSQNFSEETGDPENDYLIKKITISGVSKGGTYKATPSIAHESGYSEKWTYSNTEATFEKFYDTPIKLRDIVDNENNIIPLVVWENSLLLLPQEIVAEKVRIQIDYIYRLKDDNEGNKDRERTIDVYVPATKDLWKSGNQITYTISIASPTNIVLISPTTEPWSTHQPGGTIII